MGDSSTSDSLQAVTVSANGDGFLLINQSERQWLSSSCVSELISNGIQVDAVAWSLVGPLPTTSSPLSCQEIIDAQDNDSEPPVDWRIATVSANGDGFLLLPNNTKQWLSISCISQLRNAGLEIVPTPWSEVSGRTDVAESLDCDTVEVQMSGSDHGNPISDQYVVAIVSSAGDGFLLHPDDTRQWLSESCINQLDSAGIPLTPTPWSDVGGLSNSQSPLSCAAVLDAF